MKSTTITATMLALLLAGCGGDGNNVSGSAPTPTPTATPTPTPTPTTGASCSLRSRQDWVAAQMREWYLFPETLPANLDPTPYGDVGSYLDALTATARAQGHDRYFSYITSIAAENAYTASGETAGFGVRLAWDGVSRLFLTEAYEGAPAAAAHLSRGTEIVSIGTTANDMRSVESLLTTGGWQALVDALGPETAGTQRVLEVWDAAGGWRTLTLTKAEFALKPVADAPRILTDNGEKIGYVNLRTFLVSAADPQLRAAFADFKAQGVTKLIVDLRYNGGGLLSVGEVLSNLLGGARVPSDVMSYYTFRPEKAAENETVHFAAQPESITPLRIAFIGTGDTASASEFTINAMLPYFHANVGLIGSNTFGKPVGQIAIDQAGCDDRLRVIAVKFDNAERSGSYFNGLAEKMEASCQAYDDIEYPLGDVRERSVATALDYLAGRSCTPIPTGGQTSKSLRQAPKQLLMTLHPTPAQRDVPGTF